MKHLDRLKGFFKKAKDCLKEGFFEWWFLITLCWVIFQLFGVVYLWISFVFVFLALSYASLGKDIKNHKEDIESLKKESVAYDLMLGRFVRQLAQGGDLKDLIKETEEGFIMRGDPELSIEKKEVT